MTECVPTTDDGRTTSYAGVTEAVPAMPDAESQPSTSPPAFSICVTIYGALSNVNGYDTDDMLPVPDV